MYYKSDTNDYKDFLLQMDEHRSKIVYAKITALTFDELPIETIEGRVTQGSLNIDGSSAVRRTCSLSLVAQDLDYRDFTWGLKTKFRLEIGLENQVDSTMPNIIWFNQGIFILSMFNVSHNANSLTISLQGKDKMCMLNGEMSGALESSVDFGTIEEVDKDGNITYKKISLENIIRNMIYQYGREPYNNIIINDLDTVGLELLEYRYMEPMYLYYKLEEDEEWLDNNEFVIYDNVILESNNSKFYIKDEKNSTEEEPVFIPVNLSDLGKEPYIEYLDTLTEPLTATQNNPKPIYDSKKNKYIFTRIKYGETGGYRTTKLVYAGDLIAAAGDTITSVLDKIKNMLGEFEYFYDINGKFTFQKKRSWVNTLWTPINEADNNKEYVENIFNASPIVYTFNSSNLISAYQNSPNLTNIRNDYSIWGERKGINDVTIPIHLRYAIDKKPSFYRAYDGEHIYTIEAKTDEEIYKEIVEEVIAEVTKTLTQFDKTPNPNGLPEDWWTVHEWAQYYKQLTGEEPQGRISNYATTCTVLDLNKYFPATSTWKVKYGNDGRGDKIISTWPSNTKYNWEKTPIFLFDVYRFDPDLAIESFEHNPQYKAGDNWTVAIPADGCGHDYSHFLYQYEHGIDSYFYKPVIPMAVIENEVKKRIEYKVVERVKNYNCDWREIIYQMALDYLQHAIDEEGTPNDDFLPTIAKNNPDLYPTGITGYEQYYTDLEGFWRQLYWPYKQQKSDIDIKDLNYEGVDEFGNPYENPLNITGLTDIEIDIAKTERQILIQKKQLEDTTKTINSLQDTQGQYSNCVKYLKAEDIKNIELRFDTIIEVLDKVVSNFNPNTATINSIWENRARYISILEKQIETVKKRLTNLLKSETDMKYKLIKLETELKEFENIRDSYCFDKTQNAYYNWNKSVYLSPETLNFWFDFLDLDGELNQFNVRSIGIRSKVINDTNIKTIYFRETPDVIFVDPDIPIEARLSGYKYIQVKNLESMFSISAQGKSAKTLLEQLLYQHGYCNENITLTTIPIYYLEPNTRISVSDENTTISGDFIVNKITIPLTYSGLMTISASKAAQSIL